MHEQMKRFVSACIELTDECSVGCPYCLLEEKKKKTCRSKIIKIVDALRDFGVWRFSFGGGEPLFVPYIYEVGKYAKTIGGVSLLRTSACIPIDKDKAFESFDMIDISIDSSDINVLKKCKPNIDGRVITNNIVSLCKSDLPIRCNILLTAYNIGTIKNTIIWLGENNVKKVRIQKLVPRGKAKRIFQDITVDEALYRNVVSQIVALGSCYNMCIEELQSVDSQTLCIVKPDGSMYMGNPTGIISAGSVFSLEDLNKINDLIYDNQKKLYLK